MLPPESVQKIRCRLPLPKREELDEEGKRAYDRLVDPRGGSLAGLHGPGGIRLHSPRVAAAQAALNQYLRFEAGLSGRVRELAILITARELDSAFEWTAHEAMALHEGVPQISVEAIRFRRNLDGVPEEDAVVIRFGRELFGCRKVSPETYAAALAMFEQRKLLDLVELMGFYASAAALLAAFDVHLDLEHAPFQY
jgi:4-carboxymuconolactone decarboxylase